MKFYILLFFSIFCFGINAKCTHTRIINNSNAPVNVEYGIPIYSRADTEVKAIKSQQELQDLLHEAILTNSTQEIMQVVRAGADVNLFKDGKTPLRWATLLKKFNSVDVLKKCGAVIPCPKNVLYRAILNDSAKEIRQAIQAGADVNEEIRDGKSALIWAVLLARHKAVEVLLEYEVDPNMVYSGNSLVHKGSVVHRMIGPDCFQSNCFQSIGYSRLKLLHCALLFGDIQSALLLVKKGAVFSDKPREWSMDVFQYVLNDINPTGIIEIVLEFIQELINRGYDINSNIYSNTIHPNQTIMQNASAWVSAIKSPFYSTKVLELFMKNGANPNQLFLSGFTRWTPLFLAIENNNVDAAKFLLGAGADVNQKVIRVCCVGSQTSQQTPLFYARSLTHFNNQEMIDFLIKHGAR